MGVERWAEVGGVGVGGGRVGWGEDHCPSLAVRKPEHP